MTSDAERKKRRGTCDHKVTDNKSLLVVKWSDNSIVHIISNFFKVEPFTTVTRYLQKEKKRIPVLQPYSICSYNKYMGGVDRSDQNIGLYRVAVRGKKWYFPIISQLLDAAEQNAWQLHRLQGGKLDHLEFRRTIALSIIETNGSGRASVLSNRFTRPSRLENVESRYDRMDHFVSEQDHQTRCRVCHMKVKTKCIKCDVALHIRCFITYHTS